MKGSTSATKSWRRSMTADNPQPEAAARLQHRGLGRTGPPVGQRSNGGGRSRTGTESVGSYSPRRSCLTTATSSSTSTTRGGEPTGTTHQPRFGKGQSAEIGRSGHAAVRAGHTARDAHDVTKQTVRAGSSHKRQERLVHKDCRRTSSHLGAANAEKSERTVKTTIHYVSGWRAEDGTSGSDSHSSSS